MPYLFTHAEHQARAMMLGMEYDWRDCTYFKRIDTMIYHYFDGETLEQMSVDDCLARMDAWGYTGLDHDEDSTPRPTPYCRE
jgi:hypothetical protein